MANGFAPGTFSQEFLPEDTRGRFLENQQFALGPTPAIPQTQLTSSIGRLRGAQPPRLLDTTFRGTELSGTAATLAAPAEAATTSGGLSSGAGAGLGAAGSAAGGLATPTGGALTGAAIGSAGGPIGAAIGAAGGLLVGIFSGIATKEAEKKRLKLEAAKVRFQGLQEAAQEGARLQQAGAQATIVGIQRGLLA